MNNISPVASIETEKTFHDTQNPLSRSPSECDKSKARKIIRNLLHNNLSLVRLNDFKDHEEKLNLQIQSIYTGFCNIFKKREDIIERISQIKEPGHYCKKKELFDLGFSVTRTQEHTYVHIPRSCVNWGQEKTINLCVDLKTFELVIYGKNKKKSTDNSKYILVTKKCGDCPYIAKYYDFDSYCNRTGVTVHQMWMKVYLKGDSYGPISTRKPLPDFLLYKWSLSAALAIKALHDNKITHNDVKPENFLISDDGESLVLNDFGLIEDCENGKEIFHGLKGTLLTIAPERMRGRKYTFDEHNKGDIYSLGACFYFFSSGEGSMPWQNDKIKIWASLHATTQSDFNQYFPEPEDPASYAHLIWEMLNRDLLSRPSINDIIDRLKILQIL